MAKNFIMYLGIATLFSLSLVTFTYERVKATAKSFVQIVTEKNHSTIYTKNDRYSPVVTTVNNYPNSQIYFLMDSNNPEETSTSWQLIQTNYQLYPKTVKQIKLVKDKQLIQEFQHNNVIVVTPFEQKSEAFASAIEVHPHKEYYLYIFEQK